MSASLIGEMLIEHHLVSQDDVDKALQIQKSVGGRLGALLVRVGALSEDQLLLCLSKQLDIPYLQEVEKLPDTLAVYQFIKAAKVELNWFLDHAVIMWRNDEKICCIARDTLDSKLLEVLQYFYANEDISFFLTMNHQIDRMLDFVKKENAVEQLFSGENNKLLREMAEEAPIIELVNNLLSQAVDVNASDIHVEPSEESFAIRLRIDGVLHTRLTQPADRFPAVASRIKLIAGIDIAERRLPQDGRITTRISGQEMDIRVSTVPTIFGESIVLRLLPKNRDDLALAKLGMESDHLEMFQSWVKGNDGIVLITGPTGSGKSTTLYAALSDSNDGVRKIITVEDPVENQIPGITQIQAHSEIGYTFARALRAILRQDPDVIMIGEIRDLETAEIAIQSALTGHLVLSTIHTNDAVSVFTRLIDMGVEPFLVSAPMRGVQAQRLIRKVCSYCKESIERPKAILSSMDNLPAELIGNEWVKGQGCDACHNTGYSGRMGIYELVAMTPELQDMIVSGVSLNEMKTYVETLGFRTLYQDGLLKASKGLTTFEEVSRLTMGEQ